MTNCFSIQFSLRWAQKGTILDVWLGDDAIDTFVSSPSGYSYADIARAIRDISSGENRASFAIGDGPDDSSVWEIATDGKNPHLLNITIQLWAKRDPLRAPEPISHCRTVMQVDRAYFLAVFRKELEKLALQASFPGFCAFYGIDREDISWISEYMAMRLQSSQDED